MKNTQNPPTPERSLPERMHSQSGSRYHASKSRRPTWTLTADSDLLSDLSDESRQLPWPLVDSACCTRHQKFGTDRHWSLKNYDGQSSLSKGTEVTASESMDARNAST